MKNIQIFENNEFGAIRTKIINDEPHFCLPDVCGALEIKNISQLKTRLNKDGVIISELYDILRSTKRCKESDFRI